MLERRATAPQREKVLVHIHFPKCAGTNIVRMLRQTTYNLPIDEQNGRDGRRFHERAPRTGDDMVKMMHVYKYVEHVSGVSFECDVPWILRGHPLFETFCVLRHPLSRMCSLARSHHLSAAQMLRMLQQDQDVGFPHFPCTYGYHDNYYVRLLTQTLGEVPLEEAHIDLAMDYIQAIDHLYVYEVPGWQDRIPRDLRLRAANTQHAQITSRYDAPTRDSFCTPEIRDLFYETSWMDLELYYRVVDKFTNGDLLFADEYDV